GRKAVTVSAGQVSTLDFALERAIVQLQEIVTTATGQQARSELGNAVTTLGDVNARVETTPVTNLGDLLVAKAPGVVVLPGAMTGSAPVIRIRGLGSLATTGSGVTNNPIYVVDGVRVATGSIGLGTGGTAGSLLNDFDPNEIEDIEIVKGPSAATLYGTDAANGVIVISTRKGRAGTEQVRVLVSGNLQNELGPIHMPNFARRTLDSMGTAMRDEWANPEAFQSYGARANLSASFSPKFDLNANAGFSNTNQRLPQ